MSSQKQYQSTSSPSTISFDSILRLSSSNLVHPPNQTLFTFPSSTRSHLIFCTMKFTKSQKALVLLPLAAQVQGNCNVQSCAGAVAGGLAGAIPTAVGLEGSTVSGCVAATIVSFILPALAPVAMICWGLVGLETAGIVGGTVGLAQLAGGCSSCNAAKPCDRNDTTAQAHGCGTSDASKLILGPTHCAQLTSSIVNKGPHDVAQPIGHGPHGVKKPGYTFHCDNKGLVADSTGATCYWDCSWCSDQCPTS